VPRRSPWAKTLGSKQAPETSARHMLTVARQGCERSAPPGVRTAGRATCHPAQRYDTKLWMRDLKEGAAYLPK
jgi:hypothetical protein